MESIELVVNGMPYVFKLTSLDSAYIYQEATVFCTAHSESWNMSGETLEKGCIQVVSSNILLLLKEKREAEQVTEVSEVPSQQLQDPVTPPPSTVYQVNVPVTNGKIYAISFDAAVHDPFQVSEHFCRENAAALGLERELQITQGCVPSVGKYIAEQLELVGFVHPSAGSAIPAGAAAPETAEVLPQAQHGGNEGAERQEVREAAGSA